MSRLFLSRFVSSQILSFNKVSQLRPVLRPSRFLASWGPDKVPLDRKEVELRVFKSIASHDKVDQNQIKIETHLINDLGLDSLDQVEVIMAIEDEFAMDIDDVDSEKLLSVNDIVEFVINYHNNKPDPRQNPGPKYDPNIEFGKNY